jgi:hypothetical protein
MTTTGFADNQRPLQWLGIRVRMSTQRASIVQQAVLRPPATCAALQRSATSRTRDRGRSGKLRSRPPGQIDPDELQAAIRRREGGLLEFDGLHMSTPSMSTITLEDNHEERRPRSHIASEGPFDSAPGRIRTCDTRFRSRSEGGTLGRITLSCSHPRLRRPPHCRRQDRPRDQTMPRALRRPRPLPPP